MESTVSYQGSLSGFGPSCADGQRHNLLSVRPIRDIEACKRHAGVLYLSEFSPLARSSARSSFWAKGGRGAPARASCRADGARPMGAGKLPSSAMQGRSLRPSPMAGNHPRANRPKCTRNNPIRTCASKYWFPGTARATASAALPSLQRMEKRNAAVLRRAELGEELLDFV